MADEQQDDTTALAILRRIEPLQLRLAEDVAGIKATLPHLATRADVASKPNRGELWGAVTAGLALFAVILTALAYLPPHH